MIYVFNGCKSICSMPGQACTELGKCCGNIKIPAVDCTPLKNCCDSAGKACTQFMDKPLSSYVVIAVLISLFEIWYCLDTLSQSWLSDCTLGGSGADIGISTWLMVQVGFAVINLLFAPWFQHQVWKKIMEGVKSGGMLTMEGSKQKVDKGVVQEAFKQVLLYDLSVLFYFFTLLASFVWSWQGSTWISSGDPICSTDDDAGWAYYLGLCTFWVAFLYSTFWYCCSCCASSVELTEPIAMYEPA
mmetsp:Transcript_23903/g.59545  ORF Transcript_23903/g.59545 Transcript_23903/m.59545 type:complete len:244 (+) Transcript_23903:96-827(+)